MCSSDLNWELVSLDTTSTIGPNLSLINVTPLVNDLANPGLQFAGGNQLATTGFNSLDVVVRYRAQVIAGGNTLIGHTLAMTGITFGGAGGIAYISDELSSIPGAQLGSAVASADNENDVFQFTSAAGPFSPQLAMRATTNIYLTGLAATDTINLTAFTQRFSQTGPAGVPGDYNQNGTIDAADYTVWRDRLGGPPGSLPNDVDGGVIGLAQYNTWKGNFGLAGSGSAGASPRAVPEPSTMLLVLITTLAICVTARRAV